MKRFAAILVLISTTVSLASQSDSSTLLRIAPLGRGVLQSMFGDEVAGAGVVVVGESPHYTAEVPSAAADVLLPDLYEYGGRLFMIESCHAYSWLIDSYVTGQSDLSAVPSTATFLNSRVISRIRASNLERPAGDRMHVALIDVNHLQWAFRESVERLGQRVDTGNLFDAAMAAQFGDEPSQPWESIPSAGRARAMAIAALQTELQVIERENSDRYLDELENVAGRLSADAETYRSQWGERWYELACELVRVEISSHLSRIRMDGDLRERTMYTNVVRELSAYEGPALLVVGADHAGRDDHQRIGSWLTDDRHTVHLLAYGISGTRVQTFFGESSEFNRINLLSPENLSTVFANECHDPCLVALNANVDRRPVWLGSTRFIPGETWDGFIVFPEVTVLEELR